MLNSLQFGRQFIYNQLLPVLPTKPFQERPTQHVSYPLTYIQPVQSNYEQNLNGQNVLNNGGLFWIHVIGDRTAKLSSLDTLVNLITTALDRTTATVSGTWVKSVIAGMVSLPYTVEADLYPRYIVYVRLTHDMN